MRDILGCGMMRWTSFKTIALLMVCLSFAFSACGSSESADPVTPEAVERLPSQPLAGQGEEDELIGTVISAPAHRNIRDLPPVSQIIITNTISTENLPVRAVWPGDWSKDGEALLLFAHERSPDPEAQISLPDDLPLRLSRMDIPAGDLSWSAGDMFLEPTARDAAARWADDGSLVLARRDGMLLSADGQAFSLGGLEGQIRAIDADAGGLQFLISGVDSAWLFTAERRIQRLPSNFSDASSAWGFLPDGQGLAYSVSGEGHFMLRANDGEVEQLADWDRSLSGRPASSPVWLPGIGLLLGDAPFKRFEDESGRVWEAHDPRVIQMETLRYQSLSNRLGIAALPSSPGPLKDLVSPDGRHLLYPEFAEPESAGREDAIMPATPQAWRLMDLQEGGEISQFKLSLGRPVWSPTGEGFAVLEYGAISRYALDDPRPWLLELPGAAIERFIWSPDGVWLLAQSVDAALWLMPSNAEARPLRLAEQSVWTPPKFSPDSARLAFTEVVAVSGEEALEVEGAEAAADAEELPRRAELRIIQIDRIAATSNDGTSP